MMMTTNEPIYDSLSPHNNGAVGERWRSSDGGQRHHESSSCDCPCDYFDWKRRYYSMKGYDGGERLCFNCCLWSECVSMEICGCRVGVWSIIIAAHWCLVDTDASSKVEVTLRYFYIAVVVVEWMTVQSKGGDASWKRSHQQPARIRIKVHLLWRAAMWICSRARRSVTTKTKATSTAGGVEQNLKWSHRAMYHYPFRSESEFGYSNQTGRIETEATCWPEASGQWGHRRGIRHWGSS